MTDPDESPIEDCWKTIGVWGDETPRCALLDKVIHCHNCDVFVSAGRGLLERKAPREYVREWTAALAEPKETRGEQLSLLFFRIANEWLSLPTDCCREVAEPRVIRRVPHKSDRVFLGLVNIRGELHLCVSLKELLELEAADQMSDRASDVVYARMVVIERDGERWVFPVDEVYGIRHLPVAALHQAPATVSRDKTDYTDGVLAWDRRNVARIDAAQLFAGLRQKVVR